MSVIVYTIKYTIMTLWSDINSGCNPYLLGRKKEKQMLQVNKSIKY